MTRTGFVLVLAGLLAATTEARAQWDGSRPGRGWPPGSSRQDAAGTTHFYDERGRRVGTGRPSSNGGTTHYYDARGRGAGSSERSANGRTVHQYDAAGRLSGSSETNAGGISTSRDAGGRVTGSSRVDAAGRTIHYDAQGRMVVR